VNYIIKLVDDLFLEKSCLVFLCLGALGSSSRAVSPIFEK
jgi:hypothetical protein